MTYPLRLSPRSGPCTSVVGTQPIYPDRICARGFTQAGANEYVRLTPGKPAVDYARELYFDRPQVEQAADLLRQRVLQEVPGVVLLGEHGTKKLVMWFMQLLHTEFNRYNRTAASKSGNKIEAIDP